MYGNHFLELRKISYRFSDVLERLNRIVINNISSWCADFNGLAYGTRDKISETVFYHHLWLHSRITPMSFLIENCFYVRYSNWYVQVIELTFSQEVKMIILALKSNMQYIWVSSFVEELIRNIYVNWSIVQQIWPTIANLKWSTGSL